MGAAVGDPVVVPQRLLVGQRYGDDMAYGAARRGGRRSARRACPRCRPAAARARRPGRPRRPSTASRRSPARTATPGAASGERACGSEDSPGSTRSIRQPPSSVREMSAPSSPFVAVISSPETSGHITALALGALHRFLFSTPSLFENTATSQAASASAVHAIVASLAHCRFESTDTSKDELVLLQLLALVLSLLNCPSSHLLDDNDIWSMMKTCYRIYRYMRPPDY